MNATLSGYLDICRKLLENNRQKLLLLTVIMLVVCIGFWTIFNSNAQTGAKSALFELRYSPDSESEITIVSASVVDGVKKTNLSPHAEEFYNLQLYDKNNKIISSNKFTIPTDDLHSDGTEDVMNNIQFGVLTEWTGKEITYAIEDSDTNEVSTGKLPKTKATTVNGKYATYAPTQKSSATRVTTKKTAHNNPEIIDVAVISDRYAESEKTLFESESKKAVDYLMSFEPYNSRRSQFAYHIVFNTIDLECTNSASSRQVRCNYFKAQNELSRQGVPWDKVVILSNQDTAGGIATGIGGEFTVVYRYRSNGDQYLSTFAHELGGHTLGNLADEYINDYSTTPNAPQCVDQNPDSRWQNIVGELDYTPGCKYRSWYRASYSSLMSVSDMSKQAFNVVHQTIINNALDFYTNGNTYSNTNPPLVSLITPHDGQTIGRYNFVTITADASDDAGVARVEIYRNNRLLHTMYRSPWQYQWPAQKSDIGTNVIYVRAYDNAGNAVNSSSKRITIQTESDTVAPSVELVNPVNTYRQSGSQQVSGVIPIEATAKDNPSGNGLATNVRVQFYMKDSANSRVLLGEVSSPNSTASGYTFNFNSRHHPNGDYMIEAIAIDEGLNESPRNRSQSIAYIKINNPPDTTPPKLRILSPSNNSKIKGKKIKVIIKPSDDYSLNSTKIVLNDKTLRTCTESICTYSIASKNLKNGKNKIKFITTDKAGNTIIKTRTVTK